MRTAFFLLLFLSGFSAGAQGTLLPIETGFDGRRSINSFGWRYQNSTFQKIEDLRVPLRGFAESLQLYDASLRYRKRAGIGRGIFFGGIGGLIVAGFLFREMATWSGSTPQTDNVPPALISATGIAGLVSIAAITGGQITFQVNKKRYYRTAQLAVQQYNNSIGTSGSLPARRNPSVSLTLGMTYGQPVAGVNIRLN